MSLFNTRRPIQTPTLIQCTEFSIYEHAYHLQQLLSIFVWRQLDDAIQFLADWILDMVPQDILETRTLNQYNTMKQEMYYNWSLDELFAVYCELIMQIYIHCQPEADNVQTNWEQLLILILRTRKIANIGTKYGRNALFYSTINNLMQSLNEFALYIDR